MVFELPILLSSLFTSWALTCGGLIPALADAGVGWLMSSVWQRRAERWVRQTWVGVSVYSRWESRLAKEMRQVFEIARREALRDGSSADLCCGFLAAKIECGPIQTKLCSKGRRLLRAVRAEGFVTCQQKPSEDKPPVFDAIRRRPNQLLRRGLPCEARKCGDAPVLECAMSRPADSVQLVEPWRYWRPQGSPKPLFVLVSWVVVVCTR